MQPKCENCFWWASENSSVNFCGGTVAPCVALPPQVGEKRWPMTESNERCGGFRPKSEFPNSWEHVSEPAARVLGKSAMGQNGDAA